MPCSDGGPSQQELEFERHRIRGLAVGLCIACAALEKEGLLPPALDRWYQAHKAADKARDAAQQASRDFDATDAVARRNGFNGLALDHPARRASQDAYNKRWTAEVREQQASADLSKLKPE